MGIGPSYSIREQEVVQSLEELFHYRARRTSHGVCTQKVQELFSVQKF